MKQPLSNKAILRRGAIVADNVHRLLNESKVTADYLARCVGVDRSTIYRIINRSKTKTQYLPSDRVIARFAHIAEVTVDDFTNHRVKYVD